MCESIGLERKIISVPKGAPLFRYRNWTVGLDGATLESPIRNFRWRDDWQESVDANFLNSDIPVAGNRAGFYASHGPTGAFYRMVEGVMEAAGQVAVHSGGVRAQYARVAAILIDTPFGTPIYVRLFGEKYPDARVFTSRLRMRAWVTRRRAASFIRRRFYRRRIHQ